MPPKKTSKKPVKSQKSSYKKKQITAKSGKNTVTLQEDFEEEIIEDHVSFIIYHLS